MAQCSTGWFQNKFLECSVPFLGNSATSAAPSRYFSNHCWQGMFHVFLFSPSRHSTRTRSKYQPDTSALGFWWLTLCREYNILSITTILKIRFLSLTPAFWIYLWHILGGLLTLKMYTPASAACWNISSFWHCLRTIPPVVPKCAKKGTHVILKYMHCRPWELSPPDNQDAYRQVCLAQLFHRQITGKRKSNLP